MSTMGQQTETGRTEFWRLKRVIQMTGLSQTEIYRQIAAGRFPVPRKYPDSKMNFWLSDEVERWQMSVLGLDEYDMLLG